MKETFSEKPTEGLIIGTHVDPSSSMTRYRALDLATGLPVFERGPFSGHKNNTAGFLAIVHALAHLRSTKSTLPVYCANSLAIQWVKNKEVQSIITITKNKEEYHTRLKQAKTWLQEYRYPNELLHWDYNAWGENPATYTPKKPKKYESVGKRSPEQRLADLIEDAKLRHQ